MADPGHLRALQAGLHDWNSWRTQHPTTVPNLAGANLQTQIIDYFDLRGANLQGTDLSGCRALGTQFDRANLCNAMLRDARLQDSTFTNAKLTGAVLIGADISGCNFTDGQIDGADLSETRATKATFIRADLQNTDFSGADLTRANLRHAVLRFGSLIGTNFRQSDLDRTTFDEAKIGNTVFADTNLATAELLQTCEHRGPSSIDVRTIARSGNIPAEFLRGCGLSDTFIDYLPSLLSSPIQFYSCFISYSVKDTIFASRLHTDLQRAGVRCWYAPQDMKIGDRIRDRIDQSIRVHDKLLLVLSIDSIASPWVEKEVETAFEHEKTRETTILFPIRLDDAVTKAQKSWAADIRRMRHIGDFSQWTDDSAYATGFARLLRDLRAANTAFVVNDFNEDIPF